MWTRLQIGFLVALLSSCFTARPASSPRQAASAPQSAAPDQTPLSAEQVRDLLSRTIRNQHRDDAMLDSFQRIERQVTRVKPGGPATSDRTFRVVPTGSGTLKLLIRQDGRPVADDLYRRQLHDWENILLIAVHPDDPRQIAVVAKQQKRRNARARIVDEALKAYQITWLGREIRDGRVLEKLQLTPDTAYRPHNDTAELFAHARAVIWIDAESDQVAAIDATVIRDVSFGAGVLGKVYRGGRFHMQQAPAAPELWEPTLYEYDISGRKFLFPFEMHEQATSSDYVLFATPADALAQAQNDLTRCCNLAGDP